MADFIRDANSEVSRELLMTAVSDGTVLQEVNDARPLPIKFGSAGATDAFGRLRISNPHGIFDQKFITGRHPTLWEERLTGCIIEHGTVTAGPFQVGDIITGGTSGRTGTVTAVGSGTLTYTTKNNDFTDGETVTGSVSGASATVTSHDTGADIVFNYDTSSVSLNLGTVSGQKVIRQTVRYFPYVPGYSHHISMTGTPGVAKANLKQTLMYGDDLNGIGFVLNGTTLYALLRSSQSGSTVDTTVAQSLWNVDALDGNGPSGITLDISKSQIFDFDFQWLGVGTVRLFFNISGQSIHVHDFDHANEEVSVYMKTPTLPVRYEIENIDTTASASTLEQICCSVSSEGGYALPGMEFAVGTGFENERAVDQAWEPILAIRLKNEFPAGKPNRRIARYISTVYGARSNDSDFRLVHLHNPVFTGATWADVDDSSSIEYSRDLTAYTADHTHRVDFRSVFSGQAQNGTTAQSTSQFINQHSYLFQNYESDNSQSFVVEARSRTGTSYCVASINTVEAE